MKKNVRVGQFRVQFKDSIGQVHTLPYKITVLRTPSGTLVPSDDEECVFSACFRNWLLNEGVLEAHENLGYPVVNGEVVEYFKV